MSVYLKTYGISGGVDADAFDNGSGCTGLYVEFYDPTFGTYLGQESYTHIDNATGVVGSSWSIGTGNQSTYLGTVASTQPLCAPNLWDHPHLHQDGDQLNHPTNHQHTNGTGIPYCESGYTAYPYPNCTVPSGKQPIGSSTWLHRLEF